MDYLDIIFFAVITVFVLARLWSVLGRRNDDEAQRRNPFVVPPPQEDDVLVLPDKTRTPESPAVIAHGYAPTSLAGMLDQMKTIDATFDEKQFLQGAKTAFTRIVEGFALGDLSSIERWLAPPVLQSFRRAVAARQAAGHVLESRLDRIADADISSANLDDTRAELTVTFVSHQINVTRDAQGAIVAGQPDQPEEIRDVWVFARDLKSGDPNWTLVETRS